MSGDDDVSITDSLNATSAGSETFTPIDNAGNTEVLRGVSFTPASHT